MGKAHRKAKAPGCRIQARPGRSRLSFLGHMRGRVLNVHCHLLIGEPCSDQWARALAHLIPHQPQDPQHRSVQPPQMWRRVSCFQNKPGHQPPTS